ncbi:MAG TPA: hypothetical protein ENJ79_04110 [Gammaproteobacteria bacterium]|nr:hypothetical protein [Gammaproteobacteria bacterium]
MKPYPDPLLFRCLGGLFLLFAVQAVAAPTPFPGDLFGYREIPQDNMKTFGQWVQVLERHILIDLPETNCTGATLDRCQLRRWLAFLQSIQHQPRAVQLREVNRYANRKAYVLDIDNYGLEDYWAVPREFLYNNGDCEDYAITKLFSLRWLGFAPEQLRIVVLQDTNLRTPHAVLAVAEDNDILILDNQIEEVVSHRKIVHYAPVYSINELHWWLHLDN